MSKAKLITPHGGKLVNLVVDDKEREELLARAPKVSSIKITMRNLCDLELLATGGFSPLTTFMGKADYQRVLHEMRLSDGVLFPLPITLTADPKELPTVGEELVLRNANNEVMVVMRLDADPFYVLPIIMGVTMLIQHRLNPTPLDPIQARVMMVLPIVFTVFLVFFPAGLVLYWVVNNTLSIAQQWAITRSMEKAA